MVSLLDDMARCMGHGAGPGGWQVRVECSNCARRLAPRAGDVPWMEPPTETFPCPAHIPTRQEKGDE
jgi:hypothetical protein